MSLLIRYTKIALFFLGIAGCIWVSAELPWLKQIYEWDKYYNYSGGQTDGTGVKNILIQVFKNLGIAVFVLAALLVFVATIQLLVSKNNGEEDFATWVNTLIWGMAGLLLISIAYTVIRELETRVLSQPSISGQTAYNTVINIVYPLLNFIRYLAGTVFFIGAVYSFYTIVTAGGGEETFEKGKKIFIGSVLGFVTMMMAEPIVRMAYGGGNCWGNRIFGISTNCTNRIFDTYGVLWTIARIIVFLNSFIALTVIIMIIYAGFLVLTWSGDEEKSDKAKKTITYAIIGIVILIFSYVLYRFMILQS
jgi:hypothetical protein